MMALKICVDLSVTVDSCEKIWDYDEFFGQQRMMIVER